MADAVIPLAHPEGAATLQRADLAQRAGVDAAGHAPLEELLRRAYEDSARALQDDFTSDFLRGRTWQQGLELAIDGLLGTLAADPPRTHFLFVDALDLLAVRATYLTMRRRAARRWAELYSQRNGGYWPSLTQFELLNGVLVHQIAEAARAGDTRELPELAGTLVAIASSGAQPSR